MQYDSHHNKDAGDSAHHDSGAQCPNNVAVTKLANGRLIKVHHWFYDKRDRVCVYFEDRQSGIDSRYHDDNVEMILESWFAAAHALGMSVEQIRQEVQNTW